MYRFFRAAVGNRVKSGKEILEYIDLVNNEGYLAKRVTFRGYVDGGQFHIDTYFKTLFDCNITNDFRCFPKSK